MPSLLRWAIFRRRRLTDSALTVARAAGYTNAGTVEFLVKGDLADDNARLVFLELNPRIQVRRPDSVLSSKPLAETAAIEAPSPLIHYPAQYYLPRA